MIHRRNNRAGRRRSIQAKLVMLVLASVTVAVVSLATFSILRDGRREIGLQTDRLAGAAAVIASLSGEATASGDRSAAYAAIRSINAVPGVLYARIETADGALLAETGAGARLKRDPQVSAGADVPVLDLLRSRTVEVSAPVVRGREPVGRVVLLGRLDGAGGRIVSSLLSGLLAALFAAAVGGAVAWRLQRGIAGPIQALTRTIAELRAGHDFSRTVDIAADDETGELVDGFNALLGEIRQRDEAIARHMAGLERTVAERTADLRAAKAAADAANNAKSDFLATMSHEIRTPMNGVMVMAEMLASGDLPPRQRRFAEVIAKSGSSLLAIINDILDFSKIEAGKLELEAAAVDPAEIVEDVLSLFWERARSKGLDLAGFVDPAVPAKVEGDAVRLRQVVSNLVNNAIKFTEAGGVFVEVTWAGADRLRVAVRDTGIGIPEEKLPGLFAAFSQADQSTTRRFGGTGLGLAICKRLVEAMGGKMAVRSTPGQGSAFAFEAPVRVLEPPPERLRLAGAVELRIGGRFTAEAVRRCLEHAGLRLAGPGETASLVLAESALTPAASEKRCPVVCLADYGDAAPARLLAEGRADALLTLPVRGRDLDALLRAWRDGAPLAEALEAQPQRDELPRFEGARALVADDSAVNREVAVEALSRLGVACVVAADGREALEALEHEAFDVVLMDGSMPVMDGYEAAREIRRRQTDGGARVPIIALTAHVVGEVAEAWRSAGMDGVLHKPFTLSALAAALGAVLTPSETAKTAAPSNTPDAAEPADADLIDPVVAQELAQMASAGRPDFVERIRRLYRENAPPAAKAVIDAGEAADPEAVARAAHALKSMSLNIGARAVADLAARIESDARDHGRIDAALSGSLYRKLLATLNTLEPAVAAEGRPAPYLPQAERELLADLAGAAERGELTLAFQPQVDRDGAEVVGLEALLRWRCPRRGEVSPSVFIPLAEHHGLIRPITRWVLARAMEECEGLALPVAVNASAVEFADPAFVDDVALLLARRRFEPGRLEIEITETAILTDGEEVRANIARLHDLGVKIALDDFGVGYSSLNHLRMFAFDKLKIDRAFVADCVTDVQSAALIHAVVSVGRSLGMKIIAEGVETEAQHRFLRLAGVHALQGYLHGRPEPMAMLRPKLTDERRA